MDASRWLFASLFSQQRSFYEPPGLRRRGVPFNPLSPQRTNEFLTNKWHYTVIEAPGHRDFMRNMITDAVQTNTTHIMVPLNGNLTTASAKGNHKAGEIQGQHSRLINILGVKQIGFGVNKMDCDTVGYKLNELIEVGWKKDLIEKNTPVLPIAGWMGLLKKSDNMPWWKGMKVFTETTDFHVDTLYDMLDKVCKVSSRPLSAPMRMLISGIYKIKGVGDVLA